MTQEKKGPVTRLREQFEEKSVSCKSLQEEYLRALADFDNLRKRTARESEVNRRLALEALMIDLLPVLDNFDRAVQAAGAGSTMEGLQKGLSLIHRQLREALCRYGLQEYSCVGTQFDPRRAEAISFVHTDEYKPGTVVNEICKGYACGERVLRPARVVVAKAAEQSQKPDTERQKEETRTGESAEPGNQEDRSQEPKAKSQGSGAEAKEIADSDSESNE